MELQNDQIIYVGDPMCSWCYGLTDELEKLLEHYKNKFSFQLVMGGLRPGGTETLDSQMREMLRHHWHQVSERSGKEFNYDILEEDSDFVYDTEKPCRAVVAFSKLSPENAKVFYSDIQKAFYLGNKDTNDLNTYLELIKPYDIEAVAFKKLYEKDEIKMETRQQFMWSNQVGVRGFPAVLLYTGETLYAVTLGYNTFEGMKKAVESIKNERKTAVS